jgi:hypothetical protein
MASNVEATKKGYENFQKGDILLSSETCLTTVAPG